MRRFGLHRDTGVCGTGIVAEGIEFSDGTTVLRWLGPNASTVVWPDIETAMKVHGHDGATRVLYIDYVQ